MSEKCHCNRVLYADAKQVHRCVGCSRLPVDCKCVVRCKQCFKAAAPGKVRCPLHLEQHAAKNKRYTRNNREKVNRIAREKRHTFEKVQAQIDALRQEVVELRKELASLKQKTI